MEEAGLQDGAEPAVRAELKRLKEQAAGQESAMGELRAELRAKDTELQKMAADICSLRDALAKAPTEDVEAPPEPEGSLETQASDDQASQSSDGGAARTRRLSQSSEPWGWSGVLAVVGSTIGALLYFAYGSPALAKPVELDLECELDPECGDTSFDDLEQEMHSQHFNLVSSHAGQFVLGMGVSVVAIMICCGCVYRKRRKRWDADDPGDAISRECCACPCCCDGESYTDVKMALKLLAASGLLILVVQDLNRPMVDRVGELISPDFMSSEDSGAGEPGVPSGPSQHRGGGLLQFLLLASIGACVLGGCRKLWQYLRAAMRSGTSSGDDDLPAADTHDARGCRTLCRGTVRTCSEGAQPHEQVATSEPK
eukprot:COSAG02_NODE_1006_length_15265_cov_58.666886_1_plen_370_part_00